MRYKPMIYSKNHFTSICITNRTRTIAFSILGFPISVSIYELFLSLKNFVVFDFLGAFVPLGLPGHLTDIRYDFYQNVDSHAHVFHRAANILSKHE